MKKKMSLLLILTMLMSLLPISPPVLAAESKIQTVASPSYGGITAGSIIYFGQYTKDDNSKAPIQWRVMAVEDGKATLLSEKVLEYRNFDPSLHKNWVGSEIYSYLNGEFLNAAFTSAEKGYIVPYEINSTQEIVLPSVDEVKDGGNFGWNENDRKAEDAVGRRGTTSINNFWWLRSPGVMDDLAAFVDAFGHIDGGGGTVSNNMGVRPVLKLNLSSVLFTSAAFGAGVKTGMPSSTLNSIANTSNEIKLTLINASTNPTGQNVDISSHTYKYIENQATELEINYSNATTGTNQYLSAMITDNSGALKYYGPIKSLATDTSGTAKVTIPNDFEDNWKLKIFTEELNGAYQTDYASAPVDVSPVAPVVTYSVIFDSNGGSAVAPITGITSGSTITLPITTRSSYIFAGWFEGTTQYISTTPITKDVTLTAKWEQTTQGGGSGGSSSTLTPPPTAEQVINQLSQKDKEAIILNFKEHMPYTSLGTKLTLEELKKFTNNKFTDKQLQELLDNPRFLEKLGIDESMRSKPIVLKPIQNAVFNDIDASHWANEAIKKAAELGFVSGMPDGSFKPNAPLKAADAFTFLDRVLLLNHRTTSTLPRSTVEKYITDKNNWAFNNMASIGSKLTEETLREVSNLGNQPISRELLAQVLYEITQGKLKAVKEAPIFTDTQASPYQTAINYCVSVGLLNGTTDTTMSPQKALTRAELMAILIRLDILLK